MLPLSHFSCESRMQSPNTIKYWGCDSKQPIALVPTLACALAERWNFYLVIALMLECTSICYHLLRYLSNLFAHTDFVKVLFR